MYDLSRVEERVWRLQGQFTYFLRFDDEEDQGQAYTL